ncbi:hypothetical protein ACS0TY_026300 [Phlomoides rotata]
MMSGAAVTPEPVGVRGGGAGTFNSGLSASELNAFRISAVMDRLNIHLHSFNSNPVEFFNLCLSLSRGIDFAIANHEVSNRCQEFPSLMKQVCQNKHDAHLQAAIMVLMISVKSACQNGWFSDGDSKELDNLAKEIASYFGSVPDFDTGPSCSLSVISTIMSRFYPKMKMGHMFVLLEVKTGFDAYVSDFQISKNLKCSPGDKIRLIVVQTDNIETSSCLVTPAKVNFLLNGKGVDRRNNLLMDTGPQLPTVVTPVLKYGSNLLQAVGDFNGNYIIAVTFMSELPNPDISCLQDYEQHTPEAVDEDTEVIEGASRVSLNCPISFRRIKTPVKGHSCKHSQCFDFDNYLDINSRKPSWRCPTRSCNQHICFSDIRIDQKMVKVLKEVEPNVSNIIISSDGSWSAVMESDDNVMKPTDKTSNTVQDEDSPQPSNVLDLTQTDDAMDAVPTYETEDRKHSLLTQTTAINPPIGHTNNGNQSSGQFENDFWSGMYMSTFGSGSSNVQPSELTSDVSASSSVLAESFNSPNREVETFHDNTVVTTQSGTPSTMQLQQYQFGNPSTDDEYGRSQWIPRHITRIPTAVQALPAQTATSVLQRSSTNRLNSYTTNGLSPALLVPPSAPSLTRSLSDLRQVSPMSPSPLIQQNSQYPSARPPHQNAGSPDPNIYRHERSTQQMSNLRVSRAMSPSPGLMQPHTQSTSSLLRSQTVQGADVTRRQQSHRTAAANNMSVDTSRTVPMYPWNPDGRNIPTPPADQSPADLSWRPPGRMRGALSGQAYSDYFNQIINRPNQQAQGARPNSNLTSPLANIRPPLQGLVAGGIIEQTPPPAGRPTGSDILPNASSGMQ